MFCFIALEADLAKADAYWISGVAHLPDPTD